jgi:hypothetical protein
VVLFKTGAKITQKIFMTKCQVRFPEIITKWSKKYFKKNQIRKETD